MEPQESTQKSFPLTPGQLLRAFESLVYGEVFRRFREEGPYLVQGTFTNANTEKIYAGYYYGKLTEGDDSIPLQVPSKILIKAGKVYVLSVIPELTRDRSRFNFLVDTVYQEEEAPPASEVRLPQKARDRVDVRGLLMDLIRRGNTPALALVRGDNAIVQEDVETSLGNTRDRYRIDQKKVTFANPQAVAEAITRAAKDSYNLVALIRGGGEGLEVLDHPAVWEAVASCRKPIVVALGHAANTLWVEALADTSFATPTALGHFLKEAVEAVEREKETKTLADLLHKSQQEVTAVRTEREQLKEKLARLEREPAALAQELARLKQSLTMWRVVAILFLAVAALLFLVRG